MRPDLSFGIAQVLTLVLALALAAGTRLAAQETPAPPPPAPLAPAPAPAPEPEPEAPRLETRIGAVTLYSDQALVLRRGAASLPAARSRWEVAGLPAQLLDEAVRARVSRGGASLASLEVVVRNEQLFRKAEAEEAERKLKEIQGRHKAASDALAAQDAELKLLGSLEIGKRPEGPPEKPQPAPLDPRAWGAMLDFVSAALTENRRAARERLAELDGIEEELAVAQAQVDKLSSAKVRSTKSVLLELEARAAGEVELELAYLVPGPGWWPRYDLRASVETGKLELTSYALVRQETGEDWQGVELTFSAAEPARAADLPEVLAWKIGEAEGAGADEIAKIQQSIRGFNVSSSRLAARSGSIQSLQRQQMELPAQQAAAQQAEGAKQAQVRGGKAARVQEVLANIARLKGQNDAAAASNDWGAFVEGNSQLALEFQNLDKGYQVFFQDEISACASDIQRGERLLRSARLADGIVPPVRSSRGYDYKYRALRPETIPSDGAFNKVVLGVEEFPCEFVYETVPGKLELCFLTTKVRNQRRQPYLEGPASVFLGPDFVGDGRIPTTARGEELPVNLGADESVAVTRRAEAKRETTGFFTSWHRHRHEVEVSVRNQKGRPVRVAVIDQVPFSDDPDVRVERAEVSPAFAREDRKGLLRWELALEPGREAKVAFAYTVELPAKKRIVAREDASVKW
ncbi:MAG: mucoidy inhibitor MuiA family protein [Planctomycetes bacterium]|nr:mucoidy inhibitor MuiA family protein [Planctomycetota bacterium]